MKVKALPSLAGVPDDVLAILAKTVTYRVVNAGTVLFMAGDKAEFGYAIYYGNIKLVRPMRGGKEVVMCFCRTGDFVGAAVLTNPDPAFPLTAVAAEDTGLIVIPKAAFLSDWQSRPVVARAVNLNIMNRMMEFQRDKAMAAAPIPVRIAQFLLASLEQQPSTMGNVIGIRLTRKDIAERVGTTVETAIRVLSSWGQKNWVATEDHRIMILDRKALEDLIQEGGG
jgi:CRP-like cAMP-binding protein